MKWQKVIAELKKYGCQLEVMNDVIGCAFDDTRVTVVGCAYDDTRVTLVQRRLALEHALKPFWY